MAEDKKVLTSNNLIIQKIFDVINSGDFYGKALDNDPNRKYFCLYKKSTKKEVCVIHWTPRTVGFGDELELIVKDVKFREKDKYQGVGFSEQDLQILYDTCRDDWASRNDARAQGALDYLDSVCGAPKQEEQASKNRKACFLSRWFGRGKESR